MQSFTTPIHTIIVAEGYIAESFFAQYDVEANEEQNLVQEHIGINLQSIYHTFDATDHLRWQALKENNDCNIEILQERDPVDIETGDGFYVLTFPNGQKVLEVELYDASASAYYFSASLAKLLNIEVEVDSE